MLSVPREIPEPILKLEPQRSRPRSRLRLYNDGVKKVGVYQTEVFKITIGGTYVLLSNYSPCPTAMSQLSPGVVTGVLGGAFIGVFLNAILVSLSVIP